MNDLNKTELRILKNLNSPKKIQDFLEKLPINFEENGETCMSPKTALKTGKIHCIEGAMIAAAAFWVNGEKPLLLDLKSVPSDEDHVVALFKQHNHWGAISKTNHAVLRYREPIYKNVRELVMSYFHEYYLEDGKKVLRSYSTRPLDLSVKRYDGWMTAEKDLWYIANDLDDTQHTNILTRPMLATLRPVDPIEISAGDLEQWKQTKKARK
jgi:hypothetical protein